MAIANIDSQLQLQQSLVELQALVDDVHRQCEQLVVAASGGVLVPECEQCRGQLVATAQALDLFIGNNYTGGGMLLVSVIFWCSGVLVSRCVHWQQPLRWCIAVALLWL